MITLRVAGKFKELAEKIREITPGENSPQLRLVKEDEEQ